MIYASVDKDKLDNVLEFLVEGFGWSFNRNKQVREYILKSNAKLDFYGFVMYDDNRRICSAILLPFQGYFKQFKIISLMSWYTKNSFRGINSVLFAQRLKKFLSSKNFVITDYTPTPAVSSILWALNFRNMNGFKKKDLILIKPLKLIFYFFSNRKIKIFKAKEGNLPLKFIKVNNYGDSNFYILDTGNKRTLFCCVNKNIQKNILGFRVLVPGFHLLWAEDANHILDNWNVLNFLLFKHFKSFFLIADFESWHLKKNKSIFPIRQLNYLIYYKNEEFPEFIPPIGSELCLTNLNN